MRLIIHVGLPKAGSTAFQDWCSSSSIFLAIYGIYYPGPGTENAAFLCSYLSSPTQASLAKVLNQLNVFVAEAQARDLQALLLSSEQIFEYAPSLADLNTNIISNIEVIQDLSVLMIYRDIQAVARSSWKQAILASGESRKFDEYFPWLREIHVANQKVLSESSEIDLIMYPYSRPLDFRNVIKLISDQTQQDMNRTESPSEEVPSTQQSTYALSNESLPDFCYKFWISCNRSYGFRAHHISTIRLSLLQTRPALRNYLLQNSYSIKYLKVLLLIEGAALSRFFQQSPTEKAASLVDRFMNERTKEERQAAMEFLLINDDYMYEPIFNKSHVELIFSQMAGNTSRNLRFMEILEAIHSSKATAENADS